MKKQSNAGLKCSHFQEIQFKIKLNSNTALPQIKEIMDLCYMPRLFHCEDLFSNSFPILRVDYETGREGMEEDYRYGELD